MQPTLCSRCKKNVAVVFIAKMENGKMVHEGLCLKCAKELGLPQVNEMMNKMGITDDDLDNILGILTYKDFHNYVEGKGKDISDYKAEFHTRICIPHRAFPAVKLDYVF